MIKRKCPSPLSEGTLVHEIIASGYDVINNEDEDGNSLQDDISSSSSSSEDVVDDTDEDPTFEPDPQPSNRFRFLSGVNRRRLFERNTPGPQSDSSDEDDPPIPPNMVETVNERADANGHANGPIEMEPVQGSSSGREGISRNRGGRARGRRSGRGGRQAMVNNPVTEEPDSSEWEEVVDENDPGFPECFNFSEISGPKHCPPRNSSPMAYFRLFFTTALLTTFASETNKYARKFLGSREANLSPESRLRSWINTSVDEMKGFLAVILNMGINKKPSIESYWWTTASQNQAWFSKIFSRNRFELLLKFFHIVDPDTLPKQNEPNYDPCGRFQPLIDHCNRLFRHYFTPYEKLSVDESLVGTKKRVALTQYLPKKKHHRWGIKLWVLSDLDTKYCAQFYCYKGA